MRGWGWICLCALTCASSVACRRTPTALVVLAPVSLEPRIREAARGLARHGTPVELRVARLETRALDSADVVIAQSAAGLAGVAPLLGDGRVAFACEDEVVLIGAPDEPKAELAAALLRADSLVLADPRGAGEAAESALGRTGQRAAVAKKLRYVAGPAQVIEAVTQVDPARGRILGLILRSDLPRGMEGSPAPYSIVTSRFDGARQCPTAATLSRSRNPALARALLALLEKSDATQASLRKD